MTLTSGPTRPPTRSVVRKAPPVSADTAAVFRTACIVVFGPHYITPASLRLRVNERTIQRWVKAEYPIPPGVFLELKEALDDKMDELRMIRPRIAALSEDIN